MPVFRGTYRLKLATVPDLVGRDIRITEPEENTNRLEVPSSTGTSSETWDFGAAVGSELRNGTGGNPVRELDVRGFGETSGRNPFRVITGVTHALHPILSNHVIEWVAEDQP